MCDSVKTTYHNPETTTYPHPQTTTYLSIGACMIGFIYLCFKFQHLIALSIVISCLQSFATRSAFANLRQQICHVWMTKYGTSAEPVSWHASIECNIYAKITVLWNKILEFIEEYDIINTHQFFESIVALLFIGKM